MAVNIVMNPASDVALSTAVIGGAATMWQALSDDSNVTYVDVPSSGTPTIRTTGWAGLEGYQGAKVSLLVGVGVAAGAPNNLPLVASFSRGGAAIATNLTLLNGGSTGPFTIQPTVEITSTFFAVGNQPGLTADAVDITLGNFSTCTYRFYMVRLYVTAYASPDMEVLSPTGPTYSDSPAFRLHYEQEDERRLTSLRMNIYDEARYSESGFSGLPDPTGAFEDDYVYTNTAATSGFATGSSAQAMAVEYREDHVISLVKRPNADTAAGRLGRLPAGKYRAYFYAFGDTAYWGPYTEFEVQDFALDAMQESALGCGEYEVLMLARGGQPLYRLPWSDLAWGRVLDDASTASITVPKSWCNPAIEQIQPYVHEIGVYRNGLQQWVGPMVDYDEDRESVRITARDLFHWFDRRTLPYDREIYTTDLSAIFEVFGLDALEADNSMGIVIIAPGGGAAGDRSVKAVERRMAGDQMRELARSGLDFTTYRRQIIAGGVELPIPALPMITDAVCDPQGMVVRGLDMGSRAWVIGAGGGPTSAPAQGSAIDADSALGVLEQVFQESTILDDTTAEASAAGHLELLRTSYQNVPLLLHPDLQIPMERLLPGSRVPLNVQVLAKPAIGDYRLQSLDVSVRVSESGQEEKVVGTFAPIGAIS